jgi:hypothetical protein
VVEGASNGDQSRVLFHVIFDEEVDDIAFSVDDVYDSDQFPITASDGGEEREHTTKRIVRRERTCDPEFRLWLCHHCLLGDCIRMRTRGVIFPYSHSTRGGGLTGGGEESADEDETADEGSQTHYDLGVPYLTGMRRGK